MADSNSPAFVPPMDKLPPDNDSSIVKVSMTETDFGFRKSQQSDVMKSNGMSIKHVDGGR